jgi:hypothetical protein
MVPPAFGQLQMPALPGVRGDPEDQHGEDSKVQAAGNGKGGVSGKAVDGAHARR